MPIPVLHRSISHLLTAILGRVALLFLGLVWISEEHIQRKRKYVASIRTLRWILR